jgi:hypothetical protein
MSFCFPAAKVGPDGILLLMLEKGKTVALLLSVKNYSKNLASAITKDAFRATTPNMFLSEGPSVHTFPRHALSLNITESRKPYN